MHHVTKSFAVSMLKNSSTDFLKNLIYWRHRVSNLQKTLILYFPVSEAVVVTTLGTKYINVLLKLTLLLESLEYLLSI